MVALGPLALVLAMTAQAEAAPDAAVLAKEQDRHDAIRNRDRTALEALLAPEFVWVDEAGFTTRAQVLDRQGRYDLLMVQMQGAGVTWLSDDVALVLYRLTRDAWLDGRPQPASVVCSAVWVRRGPRLLNVFYQETSAR